jgi:hypothetical protein
MDFKTIWQTLSKVDVSKHIEKKGGLSYLSWSWAWSTLMEYYPQATYEIIPDVVLPDGTVHVWVSVSIEQHSRVMWLPVMDNRNNAIKNPDARKVSDARMRCLVKCIAMFGLGLYIYAGEDLPDGESETKQVVEKQWYNDFESHKEAMKAAIKSGEKTHDSIINNLEKVFKVSNKIKEQIRGL